MSKPVWEGTNFRRVPRDHGRLLQTQGVALVTRYVGQGRYKVTYDTKGLRGKYGVRPSLHVTNVRVRDPGRGLTDTLEPDIHGGERPGVRERHFTPTTVVGEVFQQHS